MRDAVDGYDVSIGMKRKRVVSGTENTSGSRGARSTSKRRKALPDSSDEEVTSEMDVDAEEIWDDSDSSEGEEAMDSCTLPLFCHRPIVHPVSS